MITVTFTLYTAAIGTGTLVAHTDIDTHTDRDNSLLSPPATSQIHILNDTAATLTALCEKLKIEKKAVEDGLEEVNLRLILI